MTSIMCIVWQRVFMPICWGTTHLFPLLRAECLYGGSCLSRTWEKLYGFIKYTNIKQYGYQSLQLVIQSKQCPHLLDAAWMVWSHLDKWEDKWCWTLLFHYHYITLTLAFGQLPVLIMPSCHYKIRIYRF